MDSIPISIQDIYKLRRPVEQLDPKADFQSAAVMIAELIGIHPQRQALPLEHRIECLKRFHEIGSVRISSHDGWLFDAIGDSIRACFSDPAGAVSAGISLMRDIADAVRIGRMPETVRLRLIIHYGMVHLEETEAVGSAASTCAGLLALIPAGNMWITDAVFQEVKHLPAVVFQLIEGLPAPDPALRGIALYRVVAPGTTALPDKGETAVELTVIPLLHLGDSVFQDSWIKHIEQGDLFADQGSQANPPTPDHRLAITLRAIPEAAALAGAVLEKLWAEHQPAVNGLMLPVAVVIECPPEHIRNDFGSPLNFSGEHEFEPNKIYLFAKGNRRRYYCLTPKNFAPKGETPLFRYRQALIRGDYAPCFYCRDRRHPASACPSRQLSDTGGESLKAIALLTPEELNQSFSRLLNRLAQNEPSTALLSLDPPVYRAFFDLNLVFQPRFCQAVWSSEHHDWSLLLSGGATLQRHPASALWPKNAADRAQGLLETAIKRDPHNFGLHCALGLTEIELNRADKALAAFEQALLCARVAPQKALIHLLRSRIQLQNGNKLLAEKDLSAALTLIPASSEIIYRQILLGFDQGRGETALAELVSLIDRHPVFFTVALIDPDLSAHNAIVQAELRNLWELAEHSLKQKLRSLSVKLTAISRILEGTPELELLAEFKMELAHIEQQGHQGGYGVLVHGCQAADQILVKMQTLVENRKQSATDGLNLLIDQCAQQLAGIEPFSRKQSVKSCRERIARWRQDLLNVRHLVLTETPGCFAAAAAAADQCQADFVAIEATIAEQTAKSKLRDFMMTLLKSYLAILAATVFIAMILFPVIAHFILSAFPTLSLPPSLITYYIKVVLASGLTIGLGIALIITLIKVYPEQH